MKTVNVHEAKTHLSRLLARACSGEEIIIAKGGKPWVRLVPVVDRVPKRNPGTLKGLVQLSKEFFEPLPAGWTGKD